MGLGRGGLSGRVRGGRGRVAPALAVLLALPSCGGESGGDLPSVRDSAGVRIVENPRAAPETWTVADTPSLEIGRTRGEPAYQLDRVGAVRRLSDGAIAVADGGSRELRVYGPEGRHLASLGGGGDGPGEFRSLDGLEVLPGDTLAVWDRRASRLSLFRREEGLVASVAVEGLRGETVGAGGLRGVLRDGSFVVLGGLDPGQLLEERDLVETTTPVVRVGAEGGRVDTVLRLPGPSQYVRPLPDGGVVRVEPLLAAEPAMDVARGRLYAVDGSRWEVRVHLPDGTLRELIRRRGTPRAVDDGHVSSELDRRTRAYRGAPEPARRALRERLRDAPTPDTLPAVADVRAGADGEVWVRDFVPGGEGSPRWWVLDPQGEVAASVRTPAELEMRDVGRRWVLGVHSDELGVERVRVHRLWR